MARKGFRKTVAKISHAAKPVFIKIWQGVVYVWEHPVILNLILLAAAIYLSYRLITEFFTNYLTCYHLLVTKTGLPAFMCNGFDALVVKVPGLSAIIDPTLKLVRTVIVWTVLAIIFFLSVFLTMLINSLTTFVKILTFNKEEWKKLMATLRTWLLVFVALSLIFFYFYFRSIVPRL